jgi:hypothetical protein
LNFQVLGTSGYTRPCLIALDTVLSGPLEPQQAIVLTNPGNEQLFLLWDCGQWPYEGIIIPSGFKSGYGGEGGRGFSLALCMLYDHGIPIARMDISYDAFRKVDNGFFPEDCQRSVQESAQRCEMPIPGWIFVNHWELTKNHRLWRVQGWRNTGIEWNDDADVVDDFSWVVGDKLHQACTTVRRDATSEMCQQSGTVIRDAWIEFSRLIRDQIGPIHSNPGKNDVKAVVDTMDLPNELKIRAKRAYNSSNDLHHDRNAGRRQAEDCFKSSASAMAGIIRRCFPDQRDPHKDELIRAN